MGSFRERGPGEQLPGVTHYRRWLVGQSGTKPPYVLRHMIARFLQVHVWELNRVAVHYQEEALTILQARYEATMELAKKAECSPEKVVLPDF